VEPKTLIKAWFGPVLPEIETIEDILDPTAVDPKKLEGYESILRRGVEHVAILIVPSLPGDGCPAGGIGKATEPNRATTAAHAYPPSARENLHPRWACGTFGLCRTLAAAAANP
jgi:hypothetical protein